MFIIACQSPSGNPEVVQVGHRLIPGIRFFMTHYASAAYCSCYWSLDTRLAVGWWIGLSSLLADVCLHCI